MILQYIIQLLYATNLQPVLWQGGGRWKSWFFSQISLQGPEGLWTSCIHLPTMYTLLAAPDWGHSTESWTQGIKEQASPPYLFCLITLLRNNDQQEELTLQRVLQTGQTLCCPVRAVGLMLSSEATLPHQSSNLRPMAPKLVCKWCSLGWQHCLWAVLSSPKFSSWTYWKVGSLFRRGMYIFQIHFHLA